MKKYAREMPGGLERVVATLEGIGDGAVGMVKATVEHPYAAAGIIALTAIAPEVMLPAFGFMAGVKLGDGYLTALEGYDKNDPGQVINGLRGFGEGLFDAGMALAPTVKGKSGRSSEGIRHERSSLTEEEKNLLRGWADQKGTNAKAEMEEVFKKLDDPQIRERLRLGEGNTWADVLKDSFDPGQPGKRVQLDLALREAGKGHNVTLEAAKASVKFTDEQLREMGISEEQIEKWRNPPPGKDRPSWGSGSGHDIDLNIDGDLTQVKLIKWKNLSKYFDGAEYQLGGSDGLGGRKVVRIEVGQSPQAGAREAEISEMWKDLEKGIRNEESAKEKVLSESSNRKFDYQKVKGNIENRMKELRGNPDKLREILRERLLAREVEILKNRSPRPEQGPDGSAEVLQLKIGEETFEFNLREIRRQAAETISGERMAELRSTARQALGPDATEAQIEEYAEKLLHEEFLE